MEAKTKRLQEALRALEEYGKIHHPNLGRAFETLRYRVYTLEKATVATHSARQRLENVRLYLLATGSLCTASLEWTIREAVAGGVDAVQLREKRLSDRELLQRAREVRQWTKDCGAIFIMNDRPDIARLADADGVHLGQDELTVKDARRILGPDAIIGVSTHTIEQAQRAVLDGATYLGVGPTFPSATKAFEKHAGLEFVHHVAAEIALPAFAIGGINASNIDQVVQAGLRRVAVSNAICQAEDPRGDQQLRFDLGAGGRQIVPQTLPVAAEELVVEDEAAEVFNDAHRLASTVGVRIEYPREVDLLRGFHKMERLIEGEWRPFDRLKLLFESRDAQRLHSPRQFGVLLQDCQQHMLAGHGRLAGLVERQRACLVQHSLEADAQALVVEKPGFLKKPGFWQRFLAAAKQRTRRTRRNALLLEQTGDAPFLLLQKPEQEMPQTRIVRTQAFRPESRGREGASDGGSPVGEHDWLKPKSIKITITIRTNPFADSQFLS